MRRLIVLLLLVGCRPANTASEQCRNQAAAARFSRGLNRQSSATADALESMRCDALERDELVERRESARQHAQQSAEQRTRTDTMHRELDARLAEIRVAPNAPELGATLAEAKVICERQRGHFAAAPDAFGCTVGGPLVFAGTVDVARVTRVDTYYEGADLTTARMRIEKDWGPPERELVSAEGFRVFLWRNESVALTMYPKGVRLSSVATK